MNRIYVISGEEYKEICDSDSVNSEDINFLNSQAYLEYSVNIKRHKNVVYLKFVFHSEVFLVFHILIRNPKFKGSLSYHNPVVLNSIRTNDTSFISDGYSTFIKKITSFLFKLGVTRHVYESVDSDFSKRVVSQHWLTKREPQDTLVIDFDYQNPYNSTYNRSLRRTLNSVDTSKFLLKCGNSLDDYVEFQVNYLFLENENHRYRKELLINDIKESYQYLPRKHYQYYTLTYNGKVISVLGIYIYNNVWTETNSSTSVYAFENKIPASHILHDMVLQHAYSQNVKRYDFAGLNNSNIDLKKNQIDKFKYNFTKKIIQNSRIILYFPFF